MHGASAITSLLGVQLYSQITQRHVTNKEGLHDPLMGLTTRVSAWAIKDHSSSPTPALSPTAWCSWSSKVRTPPSHFQSHHQSVIDVVVV